MNTPIWQLLSPIQAVIFDCDSTLSSIEGIDELAKDNGVADIVKPLTEFAMSEAGLTPDIYHKRITCVHPDQAQVNALGLKYLTHLTPHAGEVISILQRLGKIIYVISSGLYPAICLFADYLHVPRDHVFAVEVQFDAEGRYLGYDSSSPLTSNSGKRVIVSKFKKMYSDILYVGDGLNDYAVHDLVTRFIGYGGVRLRESIAAGSQYYIYNASLAPVLPLTLTPNEQEKLLPNESILYQEGSALILKGQVKVSKI